MAEVLGVEIFDLGAKQHRVEWYGSVKKRKESNAKSYTRHSLVLIT